jgi:hypothetical protein
MRIVIVFAALLLGLIGLAMSLCGGGVLLVGLLNLHALGAGDIQSGLIITIPCLVLGIVIMWVAIRALKKHL